jgi:hypothetical protein
MKYLILFTTILFLTTSCKSKQSLKEKQQELETGKLDEKNLYSSAEIGWTVQLPGNWDIITKNENDKLNEKGKKAIEKSIGTTVNDSALVELVNLKKDMFNSFLSTLEPYHEESEGSYAEHNKAVNEILKKTYEANKIFSVHDEATAMIDGLQFDTFVSKIYSPDKTKIILFQKMFSRLINGYDFSMTINYNNENDSLILMTMINSSKFSIRK